MKQKTQKTETQTDLSKRVEGDISQARPIRFAGINVEDNTPRYYSNAGYIPSGSNGSSSLRAVPIGRRMEDGSIIHRLNKYKDRPVVYEVYELWRLVGTADGFETTIKMMDKIVKERGYS